jgi:hypothetical protein
MGHYHPFGGGPSAGDRQAMALSRYTEVVVSNGVVPIVYAHGEPVTYADGLYVPRDVFRSLRALERSLIMEVDRQTLGFRTDTPTIELAAILGYLQEHRDADLTRKESIAAAIGELCQEFKDDYQNVFREGFAPYAYERDTDRFVMLQNLMSVELWSAMVKNPRRKFEVRDPDQVAARVPVPRFSTGDTPVVLPLAGAIAQ